MSRSIKIFRVSHTDFVGLNTLASSVPPRYERTGTFAWAIPLVAMQYMCRRISLGRVKIPVHATHILSRQTKGAEREGEIDIMWQKQSKEVFGAYTQKVGYALIGLCIGSLLLVGCGAGSMTSASNVQYSSNNVNHAAIQGSSSQPQTTSSNSNGTDGTAGDKVTQPGPQYLQKSLQVTMQVQDTRATASALQQWVSTSDPQATSDGIDYEQAGDTQYTVTLTFLVDVDHYNQVETYLRDYAGQKGNMLVSLHETVQDVTNDYIDTQTRLTDLRAEQQRLLGFLNQAQNLSDTLNVEQQLSQVEGQINSIEAHLNALKGETTFYTVTISLQPLGTALPPTPTSSPWSAVPVWQGAWTAVVGVWQVVVTLLIWLAAFSVYIIPIVIIAWLVRRWRWSRMPHHMATASPLSRAAAAQPKDGDPE